jgi:hypothetical protein
MSTGSNIGNSTRSRTNAYPNVGKCTRRATDYNSNFYLLVKKVLDEVLLYVSDSHEGVSLLVDVCFYE